MANPILKEVTVPIPEDGNVVIRNGKRVEYQLDRVYSPETKDSRVVRRVIGKVDPVQPARMFPNELYFELFPDNEVPEDVRDEFLRDCAIKRDMGVIRRNPEEIVDQVVRGLDELGREGGSGVERGMGGDGMGYVMIRRVFDEIYFAIEELAEKFPNEVIDPFKVERINEVLEEMRDWAAVGRWGQGNPAHPIGGPASPVPAGPLNSFGYLRLIEEGLTYSDVLLMLKWYKVLPR